MPGRELPTALLIVAVSVVVVVIMAAALSGATPADFLQRPSAPASPTAAPSGGVSPGPSARRTAISTDAASSTPRPSSTPEPTPSPSPTPTPTFEEVGVKAGLPTADGAYGSTTPAVARGDYITWRAVVGAAGAGQSVDVEVATRLDGTWTGWSKLTTRVADADGIVLFSWRQLTPAWISVRFAHLTTVSTALQGRWR